MDYTSEEKRGEGGGAQYRAPAVINPINITSARSYVIRPNELVSRDSDNYYERNVN